MFTDDKFTIMEHVDVCALKKRKTDGSQVATYEEVDGKEIEVTWEKVEFTKNNGPQTIPVASLTNQECYLPWAYDRKTVDLYTDSTRYLVVLRDDVKEVDDAYKKFDGNMKKYGGALGDDSKYRINFATYP